MDNKNNTPYPLPQDDSLEIAYLSHLFDNMSECYKLFWFQAIINLVSEGKTIITYDELVNEMVADAWYMVSEYRLNLGPADTLEALVHYIHQTSGMKTNEKKETILTYLENSTDPELKKRKRTLTYNVPYRLQAPFMKWLKGKEWKVSEKKVAEKINQESYLIYYFVKLSGLDSQIEITLNWQSYIIKNQEILRGWLQYNMITYLQRRNPNIPGIVNKLNPPQERKLERVKRYWKLICEAAPVQDIYTDHVLEAKELSIDHFVPWSYVTHDELWNLNPTTKSANSSKNNNLPVWDIYFPKLCAIEYRAYEATWKYEKIREEFERCRKEHVNSDEAWMHLYREGLTKEEYYHNLEGILLPVYQSAYNMGFKEWEYGK